MLLLSALKMLLTHVIKAAMLASRAPQLAAAAATLQQSGQNAPKQKQHASPKHMLTYSQPLRLVGSQLDWQTSIVHKVFHL
jgi:hypothetical protein